MAEVMGGGEVYEVRISDKRKCFPVYSTPDRVTFDGPIVMDERMMDWLLACHILEAREIEWLK
jgi:hypothetical protein